MATLQERLVEAESAYHNLMVGKQVTVYVDMNGERVEYNKASAWRLVAYIEFLKKQIYGAPVAAPLRAFF